MRLQTKTGLFLIPIIALSILGLGAWAVSTTTHTFKDATNAIMERELDHYISYGLSSRYEILEQNGLSDIQSFVWQYQQEALMDADSIHYFDTGYISILDGAGNLTFSTKPNTIDLNQWKELATEVRKYPGAFIHQTLTGGKTEDHCVGALFSPWDWVVVYGISQEELQTPATEIRNTTIGVAVICTMVGFVLIFPVLRFFILGPVSVLKNAARAIADGKELETIKVYSKDEVGALARSMEEMAHAIHSHRVEQEAWNDHLEYQIALRTNDLEVANQTLQNEINIRKETEDKLRQSEEQFRAIFESTKDCIVVWDRDYRYLYINQAAKERILVGDQDVTGKTLHEVLKVFPELRDTWVKRISHVFQTGKALLVEDSDKFGENIVSSESSLFPIMGQDGKIWAAGVVYRDVTERVELGRQISEALDFNRKLISASPLGIFVYDDSGQCMLANKAAAQIIGATVEQVLAQNYHHIESWKKSGLVQAADLALETGEDQQKLIHVVSSFGKEIWLDCTFTRFRSGAQTNILLIIKDVTEQKTLELALKRQKEELERSNQELDDFAYIASHDLKEPLRGIANYSSFLMEDFGQELGDEGLSMLKTLVRLCKREETLIEALLEYSRVGRVDLASEPVDLNKVIEEVVESVKMTFAGDNIQISIPNPLPVIMSDTPKVQDVFANLVTNAVKYNDSLVKNIEIGTLQSGGHSGSTAFHDDPVFYVRDNGIGIPEKHHEKVFNIFRRLHAKDKYGGGSGAGLTIVKKIIERHGGTIWLDSFPGKGTTFYFTLKEVGDHDNA